MLLRSARTVRIIGAVVFMTTAFVSSWWGWHRYQHSFAGTSSAVVYAGQLSLQRHTLGTGPRLVILAPQDAALLPSLARRLSDQFSVEVLQPRHGSHGHPISVREIAEALRGERPLAWILVDSAVDFTNANLPRQDVFWLLGSRTLPADWHRRISPSIGRLGVLHHSAWDDSSLRTALRNTGRLSYEALIEQCADLAGTSCAAIFAAHIAAFAATGAGQAFIGTAFSDRLAQGGLGPSMQVVPAGSFIRGDPRFWKNAEAQPPHRIEVEHLLAVSRTEVTVGQYRDFVRASGEGRGNGCWHHDVDEVWRFHPDRNWEHPGFAQDDTHPVVCVPWPVAQRYVHWLSTQTGARYRLPSEDELEFLIRAGHAGDYGADDVRRATVCKHMNGADQSLAVSYRNRDCSDGYAYTAPVGRYTANDLGLHDMHGNVWEWAQDCSGFLNRGWGQLMVQTVLKPSPRIRERCNYRITRGGAWLSSPQFLKAHTRREAAWDTPLTNVGIRLVRELSPVEAR